MNQIKLTDWSGSSRAVNDQNFMRDNVKTELIQNTPLYTHTHTRHQARVSPKPEVNRGNQFCVVLHFPVTLQNFQSSLRPDYSV